MAIVNIITANCENHQLSQQMVSRQWDDKGTLIQFAGYPEPEGDEALIFRLIVWMKESEDAEPRELPPILLDSDQWLISNYYTQLVQTIKFQLCITNETGTYEKHSPVFAGHIGRSLSHNGQEGDIDVIPLFDPYMNYVDEKVNELIVAAGDVQIDASLSTSGAAADAKATGDAVANLNGRLGEVKNDLVDLEENEIGRKDYLTGVTYIKDQYIDSSGNIGTNVNSAVSSAISVDSGKYYLTYTKTSTTGTFRVAGYKNGEFVRIIFGGSAIQTVPYTISFDINTDEIDSIRLSIYTLNMELLSLSQYNLSVEDEIKAIANASGYSELIKHPSWFKGGINPANGAITSAAYMVLSQFIYTDDGCVVTCDDNNAYMFRVVQYTSAPTTQIGSSFEKSYPYAEVVDVDSGKYIRVFAYRRDNQNYNTPYDVGKHIGISAKSRRYDDAMLNSRYNHGPYKCGKEYFVDWYSCMVKDADFADYAFGRNKSYADTIALYDTLVDNVYVTKNLLTTITITGLGDVPIYEYVFKPVIYSGAPLTNFGDKLYKKTPKILLDGSMHGFEKGSTFGNFLFLYDLVNNWKSNKTLEHIRNYCEIRCIPVSNPYGFENNTYQNENSVNINRNFPTTTWKYEEPGTQGSGDAPGDQPETQMLMNWVNANSDAIMYLCIHTNGQYYTASYVEMNACLYPDNTFGDEYTHRLYNVINKHVEMQSLIWGERFDFIPNGTRCGQYQPTSVSTHGGTVDVWALENASVNAMTLEGINGLRISDTVIFELFSKDAMCINAENTGNFIAQLLNEYCPG
jgi:hypothetical protein